MVLGLVLVGWAGRLPAFTLHLRLPSFTVFALPEVYEGLIRGGLAQSPLTATNAILATAALLKSYWPECPVQHQQLAVNTGLMNTLGPLLGGMPHERRMLPAPDSEDLSDLTYLWGYFLPRRCVGQIRVRPHGTAG